MTTVDRLYNEALELTEEERLELAGRLLGEGPPVTGPVSQEDLWRRVNAVRSGQVKGMTLAEVEEGVDRLRARYRADTR
jgi:hypothetical protein